MFTVDLISKLAINKAFLKCVSSTSTGTKHAFTVTTCLGNIATTNRTLDASKTLETVSSMFMNI